MIKCNDGLSLGVKLIDDEHKKLLDIINRLFHAINHKKTQDTTINYYRNILDITPQIVLFNLDKEISSSISTLSSLLQYKKTLGLKRAIETSIIEKDALEINKNIHKYEENIQNHNIKKLDSVVWFDSMIKQINLLKYLAKELGRNITVM